MFLLLKNATVYSPSPLGQQDILVCGGKIILIQSSINGAVLPGECREVDCKGYIIAPGFIDQHIHLTGGGGEGGFASRTPEVSLSKLVEAGTTTVVGVLGTDGSTRTPESLYAKAKALEIEGISSYMHTGSYEVPTKTITDSVRSDMIFIDKVLGVKVALADHRSSFPSENKLARLVADVRVGGMIAGKKGLVHIHMGGLENPFDPINALLERGLPIHHFSPTHVARKPHLLREAIAFAKRGGCIDLTSDGDKPRGVIDAIQQALDAKVKQHCITLSSDGNGSLPCFDAQGKMVGIAAAEVDGNLRTLPHLLDSGFLLEDALAFLTMNVADSLGLAHKGRIHPGKDADFVILDEGMQIFQVYAKGQCMVDKGRAVVLGTFE